jgi:Fic family protein
VRLIYYYGKRWHELKNIPKSGTKNTTKNTNISEDKNTERRIEDDNKDISKKNIRTESVKGHDHQDVVKITLSNEKRILKLAETKKILTGTEIVKGTNLEVKDVVAALKRLHSIGLVKSVKRKDGRHVFDFS